MFDCSSALTGQQDCHSKIQYLWDYKLPEELTKSSGEFVNTIQNCCFKRYLGVGTEKGQVLVYHMPSGELRYKLRAEP